MVGRLGWRTHTIVSDKQEDTNVQKLDANVQKLSPALYKDRESTAVGVLGMPGCV